MRAETDPEIALLLTLLDQGFDKAAWHGPNLRSALRGVGVEQALWRPAPGRHCIWELALHCAYWKRVARRRMSGGPVEKFPRSPSDWPRVPEKPDEAAWRADLELLDEEHRQLRATVAALDPAGLHLPAEGRKRPRIEHVRGAAMHDVYHAGQIRLLRRLQGG
jgi:hypothetical protein